MKPIYSAILFTILFSAVPALAQDSSAQQSASVRTSDEVVNTLATKLDLTDDQKAQIQPIIADRQQKLAALKADTSMRPMQKKRKLKGIFEGSDKKIKAVLNDQQIQQYTRLEQQMKDQMRERTQNRGSTSSANQR
jgi:periplasmic protein CpxP/Spy